MKWSAGIILVDVSEEKAKVLCLRAYKNWDWPKGEIDLGESYLDAALRELWEETRYSAHDIQLVQELMTKAEVVTYGSGKSAKTAIYFYAILTSPDKVPVLPVNPKLGHPEHDEWRWVEVDQLHKLMPERLKKITARIESHFG